MIVVFQSTHSYRVRQRMDVKIIFIRKKYIISTLQYLTFSLNHIIKKMYSLIFWCEPSRYFMFASHSHLQFSSYILLHFFTIIYNKKTLHVPIKRSYFALFYSHIHRMRSPIAIETNISAPNT